MILLFVDLEELDDLFDCGWIVDEFCGLYLRFEDNGDDLICGHVFFEIYF